MRAFNKTTGNSGENPWAIGFSRLEVLPFALSTPKTKPVFEARHIGPTIDFVADPFPVLVGNNLFVFMEAWCRELDRGIIACCETDERLRPKRGAPVLVEDFHLSYPCVFQHSNHYYMIPEAWESGYVRLYRAEDFPWKWNCVANLFRADYADPQFHYQRGRFYLFLNEDPLKNSKPALYHADDLFGDWVRHDDSDKYGVDARYARSAGPLLENTGRMFRFTQDCTERYGCGVYVSEVHALSAETLNIERLGKMNFSAPTWAQTGFHHVAPVSIRGDLVAFFDGYFISPD